jgi:hypothetical protein
MQKIIEENGRGSNSIDRYWQSSSDQGKVVHGKRASPSEVDLGSGSQAAAKE